MAIGLNSIYNSITRMSGLSGLDVDSIVYSLMQIERAKIDKVSQDRQLLLWKQEKYRNIISALQGFQNEFFNSLKPATDMRSTATYNAFAVTYNGEATSPYFSVSTGSGTIAGEYKVRNMVAAKAAKITGGSWESKVIGKELEQDKINSISAENGNNKFAVVFNGVRKEITIKDNPSDISDLINDLQQKIDEAFGSGRITVASEGSRLTFTTSNTNTLSFEQVQNNGYSSIFGVDLSGGITLTHDKNKFKITFDSVTKEIVLPTNHYADAEALAAAVRALVNDPVTGFGPDKINVKTENGKIIIESAESDKTVTVSAAENGGFEALGLTTGTASNKINLDAKLYDIQDVFGGALNLTGTDGDISFVINGQTFSFNSSQTTLRNIINTVNGNAAANVKMTFDQVNNRLLLETKGTGVTAVIDYKDESGGFMQAFFGQAENVVTGTDASLEFSTGETDEFGNEIWQTFTRSTNSIDMGPLVINVKKDYAGEITVDIAPDTTKVIETIKEFVNKYNELIDKITNELSETRNYSYSPLTDDQKAAMTEEEIKEWEKVAKSGLLAGDGLLRSIVSQMRNAIIQAVEGSGLSLASIGIKSNSWMDKGKLYIDEEKLKKALTESPEQVISLFTGESNISYMAAASDPSKREERFRQSGIIQRLYDILQDNIRTTTINGRRGALLEKAGAPGDRSQYNNMLTSQILEYDLKISRLNELLIEKENNYYAQFAKLETLINQMNAQSAWLSQQFRR